MFDLLGCVISGIFAALITVRMQVWLYYKKDDDETKALIKALKTEIENLEIIFQMEFYPKIFNNEDNILWYSYPLNTDYFPIFHANCSKIGKIKNDDLRSTIISIYTMAKFFMDCLRTNNMCLEEHNKACETGLVGEILRSKQALTASMQQNIMPTVQKIQELLKKIKTL